MATFLKIIDSIPYGNMVQESITRCTVCAIHTRQNKCVKNDIYQVFHYFNNGCYVTRQKCQSYTVLHAETIVAARTSECNVCHQTLYSVHTNKRIRGLVMTCAQFYALFLCFLSRRMVFFLTPLDGTSYQKF